MLNKHNLAIASLASKDQSRFTLNGILVRPDCTVVTDGHQLTMVTTPKDDIESFPELPGAAPACRDFKPFILPSAAAADVAKSLPKGRKTKTLPILNNAAVSADTREGDYAVLMTTDLETARPFRVRKMAGNFPDFERVIPKRSDSTFRIRFNAELLVRVLNQCVSLMSEERIPMVELSFTDSAGPVRIDCESADTGQKMTSVVMPCAGEHDTSGAPVRRIWKPERPEWATVWPFNDRPKEVVDPFGVRSFGAEMVALAEFGPGLWYDCIKPHTSAVVCEPSPAPVKRSNNVANVGQRIWEERRAKIAATKPAKLTAAEMLSRMA